MGLFDSNEKTEQKSKTIHPVVVKTQNVAKEILEVAKKNGVNPSSLDFDILEVVTYTRVNKEKEDSEWEEITAAVLHKLDDVTAILNKNFQMKQIYEIEIYTKNENSLFTKFSTAIGANATKCKIYLSIKAGSEISSSPKFETDFLNYINKGKIRAGILVDIFDEMLKDVISKVSAKVKLDKSVKYEKNETLLIADAYEPAPTIDDAFLVHYDKKNKTVPDGRVDYADRGFIHSVAEGELLMEYTKPKKGKPGRNCRGEFLEALDPVVKNAPTFGINDTIEIKEDKDKIAYYAKVSGYVNFEANVYQIKSDIDVGKVTFRTTGSISAGLESDVSLSVKENDYIKDAVGTGMEIEVTEIDIKGNVGPSAKVHAKRATIEGQTHGTSLVRADDLTINIHKGTAIGDNVKITRLEHGSVEGKKIEIAQAVGGSVRGREIYVELCSSHVKLTASKTIQIHKLQGSENVFTIDILLQKDKDNQANENQEEIEEFKKSLSEMKKEIAKYEKLVKDSQAAFNEIKQRLIHYKKNGIQMPAAFVTKYKQFQKTQEYLENIKKEYSVKNDKFLLLTNRRASFQNTIFDARIINKDRWVGHNEIIFKLIDPPIQLSYKPQDGSLDKIFAVVENDDGEYEIRAVRE